MKVWMLSLLCVLVLASAAWAQDETVTSAPVTVQETTPAPDQDLYSAVDTTTLTTTETTTPTGTHSIRDEYRKWSRDNNVRTTRTTTRTDYRDRNLNDADSVGRDVEDYVNQDVTNSDRDNYVDSTNRTVTTRKVNRYADYPEYDNDNDAVAADRIGDRMYDDYDRGRGRYWSRAYNSAPDWDSREGGCGCRSCSKCVRSYGGVGGGCAGGKCGGGCGTGKCSTGKCGGGCGSCRAGYHKQSVLADVDYDYGTCSKCAAHKPAAYSQGSCGCSKCGVHKAAVSSCGKCGSKCGKCGTKSTCSKCSRKCSKC